MYGDDVALAVVEVDSKDKNFNKHKSKLNKLPSIALMTVFHSKKIRKNAIFNIYIRKKVFYLKGGIAEIEVRPE